MVLKFTKDAEGTCTWKLQQLQTPFGSGSTCWLGNGDLASALCNGESTVKQPKQEQCPDDTVSSGCLQSERKITSCFIANELKKCTNTHISQNAKLHRTENLKVKQTVFLKSNVASTEEGKM
jgi:hypothetical protein